jgi:hypothetical protein
MALSWAKQATDDNPIVVKFASAKAQLVGHVFAVGESIEVSLINHV